MSTLDVNESALEKAVAPFATVSAIHVDSHFPHGLTVSVESRPPTLMVKAGSQTVPVAGDGTILNGVDPGAENLPSIRIASLPTGKTLSGDAFDEAVLTGAAPEPLHKLIDKVQVKSDQGVVITMSGLPVIFGTADRADEKWIAVAATLSDPKLDSLSYLDVRVPDRPAAGGAGESLADAPDPTTLGPADIVPATAETTTTADPATEIAPDPTATVDPAVDPVVAPTETVVPPPTEEASASTPAAADAGGATATGGVVP